MDWLPIQGGGWGASWYMYRNLDKLQLCGTLELVSVV